MSITIPNWLWWMLAIIFIPPAVIIGTVAVMTVMCKIFLCVGFPDLLAACASVLCGIISAGATVLVVTYRWIEEKWPWTST